VKTYTMNGLFSSKVIRVDVHDLYDSTMLKYVLENLKVTYIFVKQTDELFSFFACLDDGIFISLDDGTIPLDEFRQLLDSLKISYNLDCDEEKEV